VKLPNEPQLPDGGTALPPLDLFPKAYQGLDADTFLKALQGLWTLNAYDSVIPGSENTRIVKDILVQIDDAGNFTIAAPAIEARIENNFIPDLAVAMKIGLEGTLNVLQTADAQGRFLIGVSNVHVIEDEYVIAGDGKGGDISRLVSPLVRAMISKTPAKGLLSLYDDPGESVMKFEAGDNFVQVLSRPLPKARLQQIMFANAIKELHATRPDWVIGINDIDNDISHEAVGDLIGIPIYNATRNDPMVFIRGQVIELKVSIVVEPKGTAYRLFGICPGAPFLDFQSGDRISTGVEETIELVAKAPLPWNRLIYFARSITWNIQRAEPGGAWARVQQPDGHDSLSGAHRMHTIFAEPILMNSRHKAPEPFAMTERRLRTAIDYCNSADLQGPPVPEGPQGLPAPQDPRDLHALARAVQDGVNKQNDPLLTLKRASNFDKSWGTPVADRLWGLLDRRIKLAAIAKRDPADQAAAFKNLETGNCWEATMIMDQILRMIGVRSQQVHVYGRAALLSLQHGENVSSMDGQGGDVGKQQTRDCDRHLVNGKPVKRTEYLYLNSNPWGDLSLKGDPKGVPGYPDLNEGEGCLSVGDKLYGGLSDTYIEPKDGRTAAHNMLLALQSTLLEMKNKPPWVTHYQLWAAPRKASDGTLPQFATFDADSFCTQLETGSTVPGVPVPR
jgi:hypothetical protein